MLTLQTVIDESIKNSRICPMPDKWKKLYELLPDTKRKDGGHEPGLLLILGGWWYSTKMDKKTRPREHIEWASKHGCLEQVYDFLCKLNEKEWLHTHD